MRHQTGIALHQWSRNKIIRSQIAAPDGFLLCEFDAAGQEMRWMAEYSRDPIMLQIFRSKPPYDDAHAFMGASLTNRSFEQMLSEYHSEEGTEIQKAAGNDRYLGKFANLSLQYRTSAATLMSKARVGYGIPMILFEAERTKSKYETTFAGVPQYWASQISSAKAHGYVESFNGKLYRFPANAWERKNQWFSGSTAINFPVQGVGAGQKSLAMKYVVPYVRSIGGSFYYDLHDGLFFIIPEDIAYEQSLIIRDEILNNLPYEQEWGYKPTIPLPWDASIGKNWGELKEI